MNASGTVAPRAASDAVGPAVLAFYQACAFNTYADPARAVADITAANQLERQYADLHAILRQRAVRTFFDVGCGGGWLSLTVEHWYGKAVAGLDFNPAVVDVATSVAARMKSRATFRAGDLFALAPERDGAFDVVCSMGVLHHTGDCRGAVGTIAPLVADRPAARLYLGLYHRYGRRPFLEHFAAMRRAGRTEDEMLRAFAALHPGLTDPQHVRSWFRDQVLHPHETQHTLAEVAEWLDALGFEVASTSINRYEPIADLSALFALERTYEEVSYRRNVVEGRYFPGFFSVAARRKAVRPS
jgi:2-polyprenyl-3-methyl-5-hydroxy-6-metoxy-1,4-benzoquinol methylase